MTTSAIEIRPVFAQDVLVTEDSLVVDLSDGRSISVPVAWYPRLLHATRRNATIGDLSEEARASTGRTSTRI